MYFLSLSEQKSPGAIIPAKSPALVKNNMPGIIIHYAEKVA
jgi:hypothetical protein